MVYPNIEFVIALCGEKAGGKGAVARILEKMGGFTVFRYSDPIRVAHVVLRQDDPADSPEELAVKTAGYIKKMGHIRSPRPELFTAEDYAVSLGVEPPKAVNLQDMGNEWRARFGAGVFTEVLLRAAEMLSIRRMIIDGFRNPGELEPLRQNLAGRWVPVGVVADMDVRKNRFLEKRRRVGDPVTEEDFLTLDRRDKGKGEPDDGQQVARCLAIIEPENIIQNNGTWDDLEVKTTQWCMDIVYPHLD